MMLTKKNNPDERLTLMRQGDGMQGWLAAIALLLLLAGCTTYQSDISYRATITNARVAAEPPPEPPSTQVLASDAKMHIAAPAAIATPAMLPSSENLSPPPKPNAPSAARTTPNPMQLARVASPAATAALLPEVLRDPKATASDVAAPIAKTADGAATYYVPNKMIEKVPSVVHLWIDPVMPVRDLQEKLAQQLNIDFERIKMKIQTVAPMGTTAAGDIQGLTKVRVGDRMFAQLSGNDFEFSPKDPTPGELDGATWKWHWQVTPQRASKSKPLLLTIKAWIDESPRKTSMPSIDEPVTVEADESFTERIKRWAALMDAIVGFYKELVALTVILAGLGVAFRKQLRRIVRICVGLGQERSNDV